MSHCIDSATIIDLEPNGVRSSYIKNCILDEIFHGTSRCTKADVMQFLHYGGFPRQKEGYVKQLYYNVSRKTYYPENRDWIEDCNVSPVHPSNNDADTNTLLMQRAYKSAVRSYHHYVESNDKNTYMRNYLSHVHNNAHYCLRSPSTHDANTLINCWKNFIVAHQAQFEIPQKERLDKLTKAIGTDNIPQYIVNASQQHPHIPKEDTISPHEIFRSKLNMLLRCPTQTVQDCLLRDVFDKPHCHRDALLGHVYNTLTQKSLRSELQQQPGDDKITYTRVSKLLNHDIEPIHEFEPLHTWDLAEQNSHTQSTPHTKAIHDMNYAYSQAQRCIDIAAGNIHDQPCSMHEYFSYLRDNATSCIRSYKYANSDAYWWKCFDTYLAAQNALRSLKKGYTPRYCDS